MLAVGRVTGFLAAGVCMKRCVAGMVGLVLALLSVLNSAAVVTAADASATGRSGATLDFATLNFCNHTCRDHSGRLEALRNTIRATRPDVLALQEVDVRMGSLSAVQDALGSLGYVVANPYSHEQCFGMCEAHIFVRSAVVEVLGTDQHPSLSDRCVRLLDDLGWEEVYGELEQRMTDAQQSYPLLPSWQAGPLEWAEYERASAEYDALMNALYAEDDMLQDEQAACEEVLEAVSQPSDWVGFLPMSDVSRQARGNPASFAVLRHRTSGQEFMAVSLHFEKQNGTGGNGPDDRARNAAAAGLADWTRDSAAALGKPGLPTIMMGDFNTYLRKHPRGAEWVLMQHGFRNADRARVRVGVHYPTVNKYPLDARWNGFPPRPRSFVDGGPKIDKIMTRGMGRALRHEIYIRKSPGGQFDERFRSSDHNLVRATIPISH